MNYEILVNVTSQKQLHFSREFVVKTVEIFVQIR